ncbi:hypothetical protein PGIGA_G00215020, partial [Pangasianodon gigas]|nr:hypothetical protein [Pangasianodon gigas]
RNTRLCHQQSAPSLPRVLISTTCLQSPHSSGLHISTHLTCTLCLASTRNRPLLCEYLCSFEAPLRLPTFSPAFLFQDT